MNGMTGISCSPNMSAKRENSETVRRRRRRRRRGGG
jgi:hypothetical protein